MTAPNTRKPGDEARATVTVALAKAEAFRVFTEDIDSWWRRGVRFRGAGQRRGFIRIEPCESGRIFESFDDGKGGEIVIEIGRVTLWQPPDALCMTWRNANFSASESTEVEISFKDVGSGCEVCVAHRGWSRIRADHPVRHGASASDTLVAMGRWWGDLLTSFRRHVAGQG
jgi:hypothetical protein